MLVARTEELANEVLSRMDVHLVLNMTKIRPLDGLEQNEYLKEFGDLKPVLVNQEQWKQMTPISGMKTR